MMRTLASICGVRLGERIRGRCPNLGSTHVGVVAALHQPSRASNTGLADVTITDDEHGHSHPVCFLHRVDHTR